MSWRYLAFDLVIDSEISLPELHEAGHDPLRAADVSVRISSEPIDDFEGMTEAAPFLYMGPNKVWLSVPDVAQFLIRDGRDIQIRPVAGADEASIRLFLLGSVTGALLGQRGILALHGNVVRIGDKAMICVGRSGAGKSTLAAGFMQRGYPVIADDVAAIDRAGRALPGIPRIKLWEAAADRLQIGTGQLGRVRSDLPKFNLPLPESAGSTAVPVGWIYILEPGPISNVHIENVNGMARFPLLVEHTYRLVLIEGMKLAPDHLLQCATLAGKAHIAKVTRPQAGFALDELIDRLLQDMAAHA